MWRTSAGPIRLASIPTSWFIRRVRSTRSRLSGGPTKSMPVRTKPDSPPTSSAQRSKIPRARSAIWAVGRVV